ncbi:galactose-binding domain-like protein [Mycena floridula]|nr:galactose-binding domain-like protein [Mycena floridula]
MSENSVAASLAGSDSSNLYGFVERQSVHGLNLAVPEAAKALIKPWDQRDDNSIYADSGVDDQMIIHIPFTQGVRLKSILLKLGRGEATPRHLRVYANHPTIVDFSDAEQTKPQLDINLLEGETGVTEYPVRAATFSSITSLSLFFSDSVGEEISRIFYIGFKGEVTALKKDRNTPMEVAAADAADAPIVDRLSEKAAGQQTTAR